MLYRTQTSGNGFTRILWQQSFAHKAVVQKRLDRAHRSYTGEGEAFLPRQPTVLHGLANMQAISHAQLLTSPTGSCCGIIARCSSWLRGRSAKGICGDKTMSGFSPHFHLIRSPLANLPGEDLKPREALALPGAKSCRRWAGTLLIMYGRIDSVNRHAGKCGR